MILSEGAQSSEEREILLMDKRRAGLDGENVDMIEVPAQLTGDHLNGWRAGEVIMLKSSEEAH